MPALNIFALGINYEHDIDYICDRGTNFDEWLITYFTTPFEALTINGIEQGYPGNIMVNSPDFRKYHYSAKDSGIGFIDSYLYCKGGRLDSLVKKFNVPVNTIIKSGKQGYFNNIISRIQLNLELNPKFCDEENELNLQFLLLNISREALQHEKKMSSTSIHSDRLYEIRKLMLSNYKRQWTVGELAKISNLSIPRFTELYKNTFNVSPVNDLINIRLNAAQTMLITSNRTIEQIANDCGFSSVFYFSRIFKKRIGVSPNRVRH